MISEELKRLQRVGHWSGGRLRQSSCLNPRVLFGCIAAFSLRVSGGLELSSSW